MTFFFAVFYFQYHFSRIAQLEENGISGTAMSMDAKIRAHAIAAGLLAGSGVLVHFLSHGA